MEQFISFLIALAVGVAISLLGYFLNIRTLKKQIENTNKAQLNQAVRSILIEIEADSNLTDSAENSNRNGHVMLPFLNGVWESYKGMVYNLPIDIQNSLHIFYSLIVEVNGITATNNTRVPYGAGYLDKHYYDKIENIRKQASEAMQVLRSWLAQGSS